MTQPLLVRNTNIELYSSALNALWELYDRIVDPSFALSQDIDAWEVILRDPKAYQGVQQRLNDVAGPNWRVFPFNNSTDPGAILKAQIVEEMLRKLPHFSDARKRLAQAVFRGQSVELIMGERQFKSFAKTPAQNWLVPVGLKNIDHRRFMMRPVKIPQADGTTRIRGELYISPIPHSGATIASPDSYMGMWVKVKHPEHYVRIVYDDEESRLGFGRGIMDPMWFYCWVKTIVLKEGLQGLERWAQGIVIAKIDATAPGNTTQTSEEIRDQAIAELKKMRSRFVFAVDKNDEVQVLTGGGEGHQIVMGFLRYLDDCIMAVATGAAPKASAGSMGDAGSYASDKEGGKIQEGVVAFDRNKCDEDITLDLIGLIDRNNRPQFAMIGQLLGIPDLADAPCPVFKTVNAKRIDPDKAADRFSKLWAANPEIEIREDEFYEQIDCTPPRAGERTVHGMAPMGTGMELQTSPSGFPGADGSAAVDLETAAREIRRIATGPGQIKPLPAGPRLPVPNSDPEPPPDQRSAMEPPAPKTPPPSVPEAPHQGPGYDPTRKRVEWFRDRNGNAPVTMRDVLTLMSMIPQQQQAPQAVTVNTNLEPKEIREQLVATLKAIEAGNSNQKQIADAFKALAEQIIRLQDAPPTFFVPVPKVEVTNEVHPSPVPVTVAPKPPDIIVAPSVQPPDVKIVNEVKTPEVKVVLPPKGPTTTTFIRDKDTGAVVGATSESK